LLHFGIIHDDRLTSVPTYSFSIKVGISHETSPGTSEREHGERYGNWNVDSDLPNVNFVGEFTSGGSWKGISVKELTTK